MPDIAPGYTIDAELSPGTFRCADADGRRWVLKRLPEDCTHGDGIHPAIRERLARVRELAHARVATLATVVRGADGPYQVWSYLDGRSLDQAKATTDSFPALARGLASAVETLHARGLVHGALTAGNVIVAPSGDVWLTHVSPYLWADPAEDVRAVAELLRPFALMLGLPAPDGADDLRELATRWSVAHETESDDDGSRHRSVWAAAVVAVVAMVLAALIALWAKR